MSASDDDKRILEVLKQHGDTLSKPREIMHWAYFSSEEARRQFAEESAKAGFKIRGTSDSAPGSLAFSVSFSHTDVPNDHSVELFRSLLTKMAADRGGEYDGWETQVQ